MWPISTVYPVSLWCRQNLKIMCHFVSFSSVKINIRFNHIFLLRSEPLSSCMSFLPFCGSTSMVSVCLVWQIVFGRHSTDQKMLVKRSLFPKPIDFLLVVSVDIYWGIQFLPLICSEAFDMLHV